MEITKLLIFFLSFSFCFSQELFEFDKRSKINSSYSEKSLESSDSYDLWMNQPENKAREFDSSQAISSGDFLFSQSNQDFLEPEVVKKEAYEISEDLSLSDLELELEDGQEVEKTNQGLSDQAEIKSLEEQAAELAKELENSTEEEVQKAEEEAESSIFQEVMIASGGTVAIGLTGGILKKGFSFLKGVGGAASSVAQDKDFHSRVAGDLAYHTIGARMDPYLRQARVYERSLDHAERGLSSFEQNSGAFRVSVGQRRAIPAHRRR